MLICDFCCRDDSPVAWSYPCATFNDAICDDPLIISESVGDWAACEECHTLIQKNDRRALAKRSLSHLPGELALAMAMSLWEIHSNFFKNQRGEPKRINHG